MNEKLKRYKGNYFIGGDVCLSTDVDELEAKFAKWEEFRTGVEQYGIDVEGLYPKYIVQRTDGKDKPGEKHSGCQYFVLDLTHDPHALTAMHAYAVACEESNPKLARELFEEVRIMHGAQILGDGESTYAGVLP